MATSVIPKSLASEVNALQSTSVPYYRIQQNAQKFDFTVKYTNSFRLALLFQHDQQHPSVYLISFGVGTSPTPTISKIYGDSSSKALSSVTLNGTTLTVEYDAVAYGGCSLMWLG
jgi:hypothetical protein